MIMRFGSADNFEWFGFLCILFFETALCGNKRKMWYLGFGGFLFFCFGFLEVFFLSIYIGFPLCLIRLLMFSHCNSFLKNLMLEQAVVGSEDIR